MMNNFRIETIVKRLFDYHAFEFFGKLQHRRAIYFLSHGIKLFLNHWENAFSKKLPYVVSLR